MVTGFYLKTVQNSHSSSPKISVKCKDKMPPGVGVRVHAPVCACASVCDCAFVHLCETWPLLCWFSIPTFPCFPFVSAALPLRVRPWLGCLPFCSCRCSSPAARGFLKPTWHEPRTPAPLPPRRPTSSPLELIPNPAPSPNFYPEESSVLHYLLIFWVFFFFEPSLGSPGNPHRWRTQQNIRRIRHIDHFC